MKPKWILLMLLGLGLSGRSVAHADPCGMVPPVIVSTPTPIERIGLQKTYVFYKNGVETFVIRPGYRGSVDNFGMLIPFPTPPAIRKVPDGIFSHVAYAVDPPEVVFDFSSRRWQSAKSLLANAEPTESALAFRDHVEVIRQEAVGMYEVAVLDAGSAAALARWMNDHGYRYPAGMDEACDEYVAAGWCFVAVKTRVGNKAGVNPRPGMRDVDAQLPEGATFDGNVQAMGFRFLSDEFVVPMRLSAFNEGELRNVIYILTDRPQRVLRVPESFIVRQVPGKVLYRNLTEPLPMRLISIDLETLYRQRTKEAVFALRDPSPHNAHAAELFASDLLAVRSGNLSHEFEEREKELLEIGERLDLRGKELDEMHEKVLESERRRALDGALDGVKRMTLTVVDGDFPRDVLASDNLQFAYYRMRHGDNRREIYYAPNFGPPQEQEGERIETGSLPPPRGNPWHLPVAGLILVGFAGTFVARRRGPRPRGLWLSAFVMLLSTMIVVLSYAADHDIAHWIAELGDPHSAATAVERLSELGDDAVDPLFAVASQASETAPRGWAIVALAEIGSEAADHRLSELERDERQSRLVRTWATGARIRLADEHQLMSILHYAGHNPALARAGGKRLMELYAADGASLATLLNVSNQLPANVQGAVAPAILAHGAGALAVEMVSSPAVNTRRQAAAYLATLGGQRGSGEVAAAVRDALAFSPEATEVPWSGGALFVPSLDYGVQDARALAETLIKWLVFTAAHDLPNERQQIYNNLVNRRLVVAAGYQPTRGSVEDWLRSWGTVVGVDALERLLAEQNEVASYGAVLRDVARRDK